jgi:hypothetical protein
MKDLYYRIWIDLIIGIKKNPQHRNDWKFFSMFFMTILTSLNLMTVIMWLGYFGIKIYIIKIEALPGTMLDSFASFLIQFALPCFIINYLLIFYKEKYKILIERYADRIGKSFLTYLFSTIGIFLIPVLFYWWLH